MNFFDILLARKLGGGGGGDITVSPLSVTENGTTIAPEGEAYDPVVVNVPQTELERLDVSQNGTYTPQSGKAYSPVVVDVPQTTVEPLSVDANGVYTAPAGKAYSPVTVAVPDPEPVQEKDVVFIDYDGTLLYSYTAEEFAALTAMPANPDRTDMGLTAQGWNWTLSAAQQYVTKYGEIVVGQVYITTSGATEIDVELVTGRCTNIYLGLAVDGSVTVDWGDGTTPETLTGSGLDTAVYTGPHDYATGGAYTISVMRNNNSTYALIGGSADSTNTTFLIGSSIGQAFNARTLYYEGVIAIRGGAGMVAIGSYALYQMKKLAYITMCDVQRIYPYSFSNCGVTAVVMPGGETIIDSNVFASAMTLRWIAFDPNLLSIGDSAFSSSGLTRCTLPDGVTSIGSSAFRYCNTLAALRIHNVATLQTSIAANCRWLSRAIVGSGVDTIKTSAFSDSSLVDIDIAEGVTTIEGNAFYNCRFLRRVRIHGAPPALGNTNAFSGTSNDFEIVVDAGRGSEYRTTTNWAFYSAHIVEEA